MFKKMKKIEMMEINGGRTSWSERPGNTDPQKEEKNGRILGNVIAGALAGSAGGLVGVATGMAGGFVAGSVGEAGN